MRKAFYIDTCIWRDYFGDRIDNFHPLGEFAFQFLNECLRRYYPILYTNLVEKELRKEYSLVEIDHFLEPFLPILEKVPIQDNQYELAKKMGETRRGTHTTDIIHALVAHDHNAVFIKRDKGFQELADLIEVFKPEEYVFV